MEKLSFPPVRILPPCALLPMQRPCAQPKDECATSKIYPSGDLSNPFSEHREVNTEDLSDFYHEDTEDLEALLSSDDEDEVSSTGHSPSDLTREHSYKGVLGTSGQSESFSRKRPRESDTDVYDDACSLATIASRIHQAPSTQKASTMGTRVSYHHQSGFWQVEPVGTPKFSATPTLAISDESSSNSAANKQKRQKKSSGMQLEHLSPPLIGDSRKEKMRNIFHLLRGIFPGGESMGATFVLDQTIEYVKTLQTEVQKLQAQKFIRR
ncbi:hypothetical protein KP509_16G076700 [Ceratopteris richardii]|nr:hypothetical protein KP509_16G076700 [Ceratopteris richardii]